MFVFLGLGYFSLAEGVNVRKNYKINLYYKVIGLCLKNQNIWGEYLWN